MALSSLETSSEPPAPSREAALTLFREMLRIRRFEERLDELLKSGKIGGTTHLSAGQEAVAVGVSACLTVEDQVVSTHRGHGHLLAKGGRADRALAEFAGRATGYCAGKGGSQHTAVPEIGHMGSNGITGGGLPIGAGLAFAMKQRGTGRCVVAYIGDGAATTGNFHETLNMAALWKLPIVFVLENNGYAMSTPVARFAACESFLEWGERYRGLETARVDGNDVLGIQELAGPLLERARRGEGPALIEALTYRHFGHSKSDPCAYRTDAEHEEWLRRDPLIVLSEQAGLGETDLEPVRKKVEEEIEQAVSFALESEPGGLELALAHMEPATTASQQAAPQRIAEGETVSVTEALRDTLRGELARDESVFLMGEDIGLYGGAFGLSRGLLDEFGPERIVETPISENGFTGLGVGAAVGGLRPIVELMFGDFVTCCMDALVNHAAKLAYMYAGQVSVPFTLRMPIGRRNGYGGTHSQSLEAWFCHVPGLRVVCPATLPDAVGLLRTAIRTDAPVIFLEPKLLYPTRGEMPAADHLVPLGSARVDREGSDITLFAYGQMLGLAREAADQLALRGFAAEIVDLRCLSPLDTETCLTSVQKTGRGLAMQEASERGGVADTLIADLLPRAFGHLLAPLSKIGARHTPIPSSPELEEAMMPKVGDILAESLRLLTDY